MELEITTVNGIHNFKVTETNELDETINAIKEELIESLKDKNLEVEPSFQYLEEQIIEAVLNDYYEETIILTGIPTRMIGKKRGEDESSKGDANLITIKASQIDGKDSFSKSFSPEQSIGAVKAAIRREKKVPLDEAVLLFKQEKCCRIELDNKMLVKDILPGENLYWKATKRE